jgi:hypothetical protein
MGFDCSYHPVDLDFFGERLVPYLLGEASIEPLLKEAVALEKLRFRAKAWALATLTKSQENRKGTKAPGTLDSNLHVWGRPFFIEADDPAEVSGYIDRYLAARTPAQIDAIAKEVKHKLLPALDVEPDMGAGIPAKKALDSAVLNNLNVLADVVSAYKSGKKTVVLPSGNEDTPEHVLMGSYPTLALTFASRFRPGWMDRGMVWPTLLMANAKLDCRKFFEPPAPLFGTFFEIFPKLRKAKLRRTIEENYMVGGYVPKDRIAELRAHLTEESEALLAKPKKEKWEEDAKLSLQKIDEALADAELRGLAFVEATEVYSAPLGMLN